MIAACLSLSAAASCTRAWTRRARLALPGRLGPKQGTRHRGECVVTWWQTLLGQGRSPRARAQLKVRCVIRCSRSITGQFSWRHRAHEQR